MVTKARLDKGVLDPVKAYKEISAATPPQGNKVSGGDRYKVAGAGFGKFADGGSVRGGRFAETAPAVASTGPTGDTYRVELMVQALTDPNLAVGDRAYLLARALKDSIRVS